MNQDRWFVSGHGDARRALWLDPDAPVVAPAEGGAPASKPAKK